jgi:amidophosphoribosyltransferase
VITSETCALDVGGAAFVLDVQRGEIVSIDASGMRSTKIPRTDTKRAMCSFEFVYFAAGTASIGSEIQER